MTESESSVYERLGTAGFERVLDDLMDKSRLARLASACELKYPGMRVRSIRRERLLADLVKAAADADAARATIERALKKETRAAARKWERMSAEDKAKRLADESYLLSNGNLGLYLYLLATADSDPQGEFESRLALPHLLRVMKNGAQARDALASTRTENRLRKQISELERKLAHIDGQLTKSRDKEKQLKRDLIQRKGDLAETRLLAERLRGDLARAEASVSRVAKKTEPPTDGAFDQVAGAVRKLAGEQRKLTHRLAKLNEPASATPATAPAELATIGESLKALQKEVAALKRERKKESLEQGEQLKDLRTGVSALQKAAARSGRRLRLKGAEARVGVFIDVQNVYYGARKLKGKLDFDALLQAAVGDRRLIQSTAYVVESKEIDQSGFIAMLQKRAIEVRRKSLKVRADGSMKGDWDMELALDILDSAKLLDVVVLVSGDGDFTSLVKRVKRGGPRVEVIGFPRNTAKSLVEAADLFQPLDRKFMIYPPRAKPGARTPAAPPKAAHPPGQDERKR